MENKFLTSVQLWQDFCPDAAPLDVNYVQTETVDNVEIRSLFYQAIADETGEVRAFARLLIPAGSDGSRLVLFIPDPANSNPLREALRIAERGYQVGYVDVRGDGEIGTSYQGGYTHAAWQNAEGNLYLATPSALANPVVVWVKMVARYLVLLREQRPDLRPIAYAEKQGNLILWPLASGIVPLQAGVSILGSGLVNEKLEMEDEENMRRWAIALSPQCYAKRTTIPMLFVTTTNHESGSFDHLEELVKQLPELNCTVVASCRLAAQVSQSAYRTMWRWISSQYGLADALPTSPAIQAAVEEDVVRVHVSYMEGTNPISIRVFYSYNEVNPVFRSWHALVTPPDVSHFDLPIRTNVDRMVVYAVVEYEGPIGVSSTPLFFQFDENQPRRRSVATRLLYDTSMAPLFFGETDGVELPDNAYGIATTPDGLTGVYVTKGNLSSCCVGEHGRLVAEGTLQISAYSVNERPLTIALTAMVEGEVREFSATVHLTGGTEWQRIRLGLDDFRDGNKIRLSDWNWLKRITFIEADGVLFNNMLWV